MPGLLGLFRPALFAEDIESIDLQFLSERGIRALMLDLDNTLLPWRDSEVPDSSRRWVEKARDSGFQLCIVSNTHNPRRLNEIAAQLGVPSVHRALKPRRYGFAKALQTLGCEPSAAAVVGDQILTDILGGNLAGMFTILVRPMHPREFVGTKISRMLERLILALLRRSGGLEQTHSANSQKDRDSR